ncbi:MAG: DUF2807 domain-containing protein [Litorimonas sp.]
MKTLLATTSAAILVAALSLPAWAGDRSSAKRDVVTQHDLSGFDKIEVSGVYELDIREGDRFSVRTEATEKDARRQDVTVSNGRLILAANDDEKRNWNPGDRDGSILAVITLPRLSGLEVAGVATGEVSAFTGGNLSVEIAGVGNLELSGECDSLEIEMAGVGEVDAEDLVCEDVEATLGGVGELSVHATRRVEANAGGIGQIEVYGDPGIRDVSDGFMAKVRFD